MRVEDTHALMVSQLERNGEDWESTSYGMASEEKRNAFLKLCIPFPPNTGAYVYTHAYVYTQRWLGFCWGVDYAADKLREAFRK